MEDHEDLFTKCCGFGFDIALVQRNPTVIGTLLNLFKRLDFDGAPDCIELSFKVFEVASAREDLAMSTIIKQNLTFDLDCGWSPWTVFREELKYILRKTLRLRNRKIFPLIFQRIPFEVPLDFILGNIVWLRFKSALRSFLLKRQFKIPLQFLSLMYIYFQSGLKELPCLLKTAFSFPRSMKCSLFAFPAESLFEDFSDNQFGRASNSFRFQRK